MSTEKILEQLDRRIEYYETVRHSITDSSSSLWHYCDGKLSAYKQLKEMILSD